MLPGIESKCAITHLMNQLIECVLAIGAWFSPNDWAGVVVDALASLRNTFAVALHVTLLEVGGKAVQILIVWKKCVCFSAKEIRVPNTEQCQNDWCILLEWSIYEVLIHKIGTFQQLFKVFEPDGQ